MPGAKIVKVWDRAPGTFLLGPNRNELLVKNGWRSPQRAARYERAIQETIGRGLQKRIKAAVN